MANHPNLSTQLAQDEGKYVYAKTDRISLRPRRSRNVQLNDGSYAAVDDPPLYIEIKDRLRSDKLDPSNPADKEKLDELQKLMDKHPQLATDARYKVQVVGEYQAQQPWLGYENQTADEAEATYRAVPAKPNLEQWMKFELDKGDDTDPEMVKLVNKLFREQEKEQKASTTEAVDLT